MKSHACCMRSLERVLQAWQVSQACRRWDCPTVKLSLTNASLFFFFFQAEDGIRDRNVTGVQTCALPISRSGRRPSATENCHAAAWRSPPPTARAHAPPQARWRAECHRAGRRSPSPLARSEERRVGKECRCGWSPEHEKKKGRRVGRGLRV